MTLKDEREHIAWLCEDAEEDILTLEILLEAKKRAGLSTESLAKTVTELDVKAHFLAIAQERLGKLEKPDV